jgi:hypothetical protein
MPQLTHTTYVRSSSEHAAEVATSIRTRTESNEARSSTRYDDVDMRLMDTFPASDAVARY